jgi:hypothetical protein
MTHLDRLQSVIVRDPFVSHHRELKVWWESAKDFAWEAAIRIAVMIQSSEHRYDCLNLSRRCGHEAIVAGQTLRGRLQNYFCQMCLNPWGCVT